jgi:LDH2 family malate/lactate/ureidoglycolate dehydrogenase
MQPSVLTFTAETLLHVSQTLLEAAGTPADLARIVSRGLVGANLAGHDSHGVLRLPWYVKSSQLGQVKPAARPSVQSRSQATARVDGAWGWGQPAAHLATQIVLELAQQYGIGAVTIDHCNHIGRLGEYVEIIAQADQVGLMVCNTEVLVTPFAARQRVMGTNPIAIAVPRGAGQDPLISDFATSTVAEGKLRVARAKGQNVAPGLLLDRDGQPTQDPNDFYTGGMLLPLGGHKGSGLSLMIELLGGALSGMATAALPDFQGGNGTLVIAFNISTFVPPAVFMAQTTALAEVVKTVPAADGFSEVLLPGEPERLSRQRRQVEGIPLAEQTWQELQELASHLKVTL